MKKNLFLKNGKLLTAAAGLSLLGNGFQVLMTSRIPGGLAAGMNGKLLKI